MRFLALFLLTCALPQVVHAQQLSMDELDDLMLSRFRDSNDKVGVLKAEFDAFNRGSGCDSSQMALFFWTHLQTRDPDWSAPRPVAQIDCPVRNHALHYALGNLAFAQGDWASFEHHFRQALQTANTPFKRHMAWQGMGVLHQRKGQLDSAYHAFANSYEEGREFVGPIGMNNLANAALLTEQWQEAVEWTALAEDLYYKELKSGGLEATFGANFRDEVLSNRLLAEMNLLDREAAAATFERMRFVPSREVNSVMVVATAMAYLVWADRESDLAPLRGQFEETLAVDSALAVEVMGAHVVGFEPWRSQWLSASGMEESDLWTFMQQVPLVFRDAAVPRQAAVEHAPDPAPVNWAAGWPVVTFALWGAAAGFGVHWWRKRRAWEQMDEADLGQIVNTAFTATPDPRAAEALHRLAAQTHNPSAVRHQQIHDVLTPRESDVLNDWVEDIRPKETAARLGISAASVYNVRVTVRKKLSVPEGEDVVDWYTSQVLHPNHTSS